MLQRLRREISWLRAARLFQHGDALRNRQTGDRAENLKRAIVAYREALQFFTAQGDPWQYAATQGNLGLAYAELPAGDRATNLDWAIACFGEALRFFTAEAAPLEYARTQEHLGSAYRDLPTGDRGVNLEQAFACYGEALRFLTAEAAPQEYAKVKASVGIAYAELSTGDRQANLEKAIACHTEALRFLTDVIAPMDYATTQTYLGLAYFELTTGDRQVNLEQAIVCYREALRFITYKAAPHEYATVQNNLGNAHRELPKGDRGTNLEQAIGCYIEALRFLTAWGAPREYAMTQDHLGNAYSELPTGDRQANLERAIACHSEALRFFSVETAPNDYALAQNNLGSDYLELRTGDREGNLTRAIACFQEALRFWTAEAVPRQYAMAQNNLGNACVERYTGDRQANLERAIACYTEALRFWTAEADPRQYAGGQMNLGNAYTLLAGDQEANLEQAIACYTEALRFWTAEAAPLNYAAAQLNLARAYARTPTGGRATRLKQAVASYREALRFFPADAMPARHRAAAGGLGLLYFREEEWETAQAAFASALRAGDRLYEATATEAGRQAELGEAGEFVAHSAYCLALLGRPNEAVECAESGRTRALAEALARDRASLVAVTAFDRAAFESTRDQIKVLEAEARGTGDRLPGDDVSRPFVELSEALAAARGELSTVVERIREYVPGFMAEALGFGEIARSARAGRPLVYLLSTTKGSLALIVERDATAMGEQHLLWLDFTSNNLDALLWGEHEGAENAGGLLRGQVMGDFERLESALERGLPFLHERIMEPLAERLREFGASEATVVPTGRLSLLPLPAAAGEELVVVLAPSARALRECAAAAEHAAARVPTLLAVGNPLPLPPGIQSLDFAGAEVEAIASFIADSHVLIGVEATRRRIYSHAEGTTHLHFASHGSFDTSDPLDSGLVLSEGDRFTLRDLLDEAFQLRSPRLAVLSACQSGITEYTRVPDEAIGLPAGFIQAGVPGVVSTLWPVNDVSTALLMVEFYRLLLTEELDPALALQMAQQILRTSTAEQLDVAGWFERADLSAAASYYRSNPNGRPFEKPLYWAGFVFSGV